MSDEVSDLQKRVARLERQVKWLGVLASGFAVGLALLWTSHDSLSREVDRNERAAAEARQDIVTSLEVLAKSIPQNNSPPPR